MNLILKLFNNLMNDTWSSEDGKWNRVEKIVGWK
jgi:hypothetical protein